MVARHMSHISFAPGHCWTFELTLLHELGWRAYQTWLR